MTSSIQGMWKRQRRALVMQYEVNKKKLGVSKQKHISSSLIVKGMAFIDVGTCTGCGWRVLVSKHKWNRKENCGAVFRRVGMHIIVTVRAGNNRPGKRACDHIAFSMRLGKESVCSCLEQIPFWIARLPSKVIPRLESHHYSIRVGLYFTGPILQQSARRNCLRFSGLPPIIESSFKTWDGQRPVWSRLSGSSRTSVCTVVQSRLWVGDCSWMVSYLQ